MRGCVCNEMASETSPLLPPKTRQLIILTIWKFWTKKFYLFFNDEILGKVEGTQLFFRVKSCWKRENSAPPLQINSANKYFVNSKVVSSGRTKWTSNVKFYNTAFIYTQMLWIYDSSAPPSGGQNAFRPQTFKKRDQHSTLEIKFYKC